jgi:isoaspartyl peptidase/L-asparaginase-like protein (Ntn-hydrolase superfamily)
VAGLDGGLIALGRDGSLAMPFNTGLMYRGVAAGDRLDTAIWPVKEGGQGG